MQLNLKEIVSKLFKVFCKIIGVLQKSPIFCIILIMLIATDALYTEFSC